MSGYNNCSSEVPQWVIDYNNAGHQSSAGKAIGILMKENQSLRSELQKQKELNAELVSAIRVYVFQMDKFFGEPKVGQPPGLEMFREIIERESLIKKSKES